MFAPVKPIVGEDPRLPALNQHLAAVAIVFDFMNPVLPQRHSGGLPLFIAELLFPCLHGSSQEREREPDRFPLPFFAISIRLIMLGGLLLGLPGLLALMPEGVAGLLIRRECELCRLLTGCTSRDKCLRLVHGQRHTFVLV